MALNQDASKFKAAVKECMETSHFLLQGGQSFEIKVAHTESMKIKESVKNVISATIALVSLVLYCGQTKHNRVSEIYLQTSKSAPLPLVLKDEKAAE